MAPEVLAGSAATPAADMWAFGLIVHEVATGKRVSAGQPPDASLPPAWGTGIQRCLALDPALRPKSASSVIAAFSTSPAVPKPYRARSSALRLALVLCIAAAAVGLGVKYLWTPHNLSLIHIFFSMTVRASRTCFSIMGMLSGLTGNPF